MSPLYDGTMNRGSLFAGACAAMFLFGIILAILGALFGLPEMRARLDLSLLEQGHILLSLFGGVFVSTLLAGPAIHRYGGRGVLTAGGTLAGVGFVLLSEASGFTSAAGAALSLGLGGGALNTAANALVADLYPHNRGAMLNIVGVFFGVGAMSVPTALALFGRVSVVLLSAAALTAVVAVWYASMQFPVAAVDATFSATASLHSVRLPGVILLACLLAFQSGIEGSIGGWVSTYAGFKGGSGQAATAVLAGFWTAMVAGRLLGARLVRRVEKATLVVFCGAVSAGGCALLLASTSMLSMLIGAVLAGLAFAPVYPTILAVAADRHPRQAATIFGFLFAAGLVGGMIVPWAVGRVAEAYGMQAGMALPVAGAAAVAILAFFVGGERDV